MMDYFYAQNSPFRNSVYLGITKTNHKMRKLLFILFTLSFIACNNTSTEAVQISNADRIMKLYDAFAQGDVPSVLEGLTADINWMEAENFIYADGNPYVGHDAVVNGVFARLDAEWEYWNLADKAIMNVEGDKVLVTGRYQAKNKVTGKVLDSQFAHLWTMKDTLAASFQQFTDTKQAAEVVLGNSEGSF
jgi:ketosteroid isomerase-like protein